MMIFLLLFAFMCIVSLVDVSDRFLDNESEHILYCDDSEPVVSEDATPAEDTKESESVTDASEEKQAHANANNETSSAQPERQSTADSHQHKQTDLEALDDLDDEDEDEVAGSASSVSKQLIDEGVDEVLKMYNGGSL